MSEIKPCVACKGRASTNQIDSSVGVLSTVQCEDTNCGGHWRSAWFEDEGDAVAWWNDRQIGVAAMTQVLPFNAAPGGEDISEFERARIDAAKDNTKVTPEQMLRVALHDLRTNTTKADGMLLYLFDKAGDGRYGTRQVYIANMDRVEEIAYLDYCKMRALEDWKNA